MKEKISIAVTDFALPAPLRGSIDTYSGFSAGLSFGVELHLEVQRQRAQDPDYESEVFCSHKFKSNKYIFEVSGIMDGIFRASPYKIEEIKSAFDLNKLHRYIKENEDDHPYCLQLRTYGYIYWLKRREIPELNLHLISSRNKKSIDYSLELDIKKYEDWLHRRLKDLSAEVEFSKERSKKRKKMADALEFPFVVPRPGQKELIASVDAGMRNKQHLMFQAPTGLGKTIGILYPSLKESLKRGQKVIYLTPKNSQHLVAQDAIKGLRDCGPKIKSMTITAKKKICMKQEPMCNAEYCEFAQDHYTKIEENNILEKLKRQKQLNVRTFKRFAEDFKVCPYELQMDMIPHVETVICDYNYVFSPRTAGSRVAKLHIAENEKPNVIIDEAHNLPARAIDYYSPALQTSWFEKCGRNIDSLPEEFRENFGKILNHCIRIIKESAAPNKRGPHIIIPDVKAFVEQEGHLRDFLSSYLESDVVIGPNDMVLGIYNYWTEFTAALEWATMGKPEFFTSYVPNPEQIKITCCDASDMLKASYNEFDQVVGFSATLKPFGYYSQLSGLKTKKLHTSEFVSPFPKHNRKIILIPQISSKYNDRQRNYPRIAEVIKRISALKHGNYFSFFPSFDFMEKVLNIFTPPDSFNVISQSRGMRQQEVKKLLEELSHTSKANIIFAVQGSVLAEGIDYPGDLAIGAFIVGAPLPGYDWEREKMREYYEKHYSAGTDYAYTFPAMAKAVQAAGRVIRSETDKGIIILMDSRFLQENYHQCMPQDWFDNNPKEMVSQAILNDIQQFWADS